jgi:hypothetical protein
LVRAQLKLRPFLFWRQRLIATEVVEVADHVEFGVTGKVEMQLIKLGDGVCVCDRIFSG